MPYRGPLPDPPPPPDPRIVPQTVKGNYPPRDNGAHPHPMKTVNLDDHGPEWRALAIGLALSFSLLSLGFGVYVLLRALLGG